MSGQPEEKGTKMVGTGSVTAVVVVWDGLVRPVVCGDVPYSEAGV